MVATEFCVEALEHRSVESISALHDCHSPRSGSSWDSGLDFAMPRPIFPFVRRTITEGAIDRAFGIIHFFPGGTEDNYKASIAAVHPADGLPEGQIFHAAGASEGGWTIMAVHESKASWEKFRDDILMPRLTAGIEGGFSSPPPETEVHVTTLLP